jgi:hypothetical protein
MLDLKLPRVMGLEVLKWLRNRPEFDSNHCKLCSVPPHALTIFRTLTYHLRANAYLVKPSGLEKSSHGSSHQDFEYFYKTSLPWLLAERLGWMLLRSPNLKIRIPLLPFRCHPAHAPLNLLREVERCISKEWGQG